MIMMIIKWNMFFTFATRLTNEDERNILAIRERQLQLGVGERRKAMCLFADQLIATREEMR